MQLKDKIILITGASAGLGAEAAFTYAKFGATVILLGKNTQQLTVVYDHIVKNHWPTPAIYPMNLAGANIDNFHELANIVEKEFGKLDGLLHNAALLETLTPLEHYPAERWYKVMQTNVNAPFLLTQTLLPVMKKSDHASIIFTLDNAAKAYRGAYGVSKMALLGLMQILADEWETNKQIRVNGIAPCVTRTALRARMFPGEEPTQHPQPAQLMSAYLYLMSDESLAVKGKILTIQKNGEWIYAN